MRHHSGQRIPPYLIIFTSLHGSTESSTARSTYILLHDVPVWYSSPAPVTSRKYCGTTAVLQSLCGDFCFHEMKSVSTPSAFGVSSVQQQQQQFRQSTAAQTASMLSILPLPVETVSVRLRVTYICKIYTDCCTAVVRGRISLFATFLPHFYIYIVRICVYSYTAVCTRYLTE